MVLNRWPLGVALPLAALALLPLGVVAASWLQHEPEVWQHLREHVLGAVLWQTLLLALGVATGVLLLGVSLAWLTTVCSFPGRRWLSAALVLPLALPAYVLAFVHVGLWDYSGPLQTAWRALGGEGSGLRVRTLAGAVVVFSLALYPYVYLLMQQALRTQGLKSLQAAQTLGMNRWQAFWRVVLPLSRPWWAAGLGLALMELLADFGAVSIFNVDSFTTAIYKTWLGMFNLNVASQLASLLALVALVLVWLEQSARSRQRHGSVVVLAPHERIVLRGWRGGLALGWCLLVLAAAFAVPMAQLLWWAWTVAATDLDTRYAAFVLRTLTLGALCALLVVVAALLLAYAARHAGGGLRGALTAWLVRASALGYALPGMVLSVGLFVAAAGVDALGAAALEHWGVVPGWLRGTVAVMVLALMVRFLAVGLHPISAGMQRITVSQEAAARTLGLGPWASLRALHLPLLRPGLLGAGLLVFVEVVKEMPITLMMRPFGWDTLAVRIFEMTSEGMWERAALPAVCVVLVGLLPLALLNDDTHRT